MTIDRLAALNFSDIAFFSIFMLFVLLLLFGIFFFGLWLTRQKDSVSPYTGFPLRRGSDLSYFNIENVLRYLYNLHQYDNRIFDLKRAAFCRETGRIFPNAITWYDKIKVNWSFLQKRYPGKYVSWGSLTESQQEDIRHWHHSLEGYQTEFSSPTPSPRLIEQEYAYSVPGPLYVDLETKVLLGWKNVPRTDLEVLIVQKPRGIFEPQKL